MYPKASALAIATTLSWRSAASSGLWVEFGPRCVPALDFEMWHGDPAGGSWALLMPGFAGVGPRVTICDASSLCGGERAHLETQGRSSSSFGVRVVGAYGPGRRCRSFGGRFPGRFAEIYIWRVVGSKPADKLLDKSMDGVLAQ